MARAYDLGPGEVMALLEADRVNPGEALKLTLKALVLQRALRIEERTRKALIGTSRSSVLVPGGADPAGGTAGDRVFRALGPDPAGIPVDQAVARLRKAYGQAFAAFRDEVLLPRLVALGLMEARTEKVMFVFSRRRHHLTPAGQAEKARLDGLMSRAREVPSYLASNPAQAVAVLATLGASVLLVEELKPYFAQIGEAMRGLGAEALDLGAAGLDGAPSSLAGADLGGLDLQSLDLGSLDLGALDSLDADLGGFDASLDSSSGGDSGGDGGRD